MSYSAVKSYSVASLTVMISGPVMMYEYRSASSCATVLMMPPAAVGVYVMASMKSGSDAIDCGTHSFMME